MNWFKRILAISFLSVVMPVLASAHSVTLSLTRSPDDSQATGQGYTAWRMSGACPASVTTTAGFTALNATLFTTTTYVDTTVVPGLYCYIATFTDQSRLAGFTTSVPSNTAPAIILPAPPTNVTVPSTN